MRVSRLEIFGFKSFMERLVLPFDGGLTGVVGPNGCGKSNIVDAVRWVLGETHAKNLRGTTLEDVIFNGTSELRPLGLAEVTITLRADGDSLFEDISQRVLAEQELEFSAHQSSPTATASESEVPGDAACGEKVADTATSSREQPSEPRQRFRVLEGGAEQLSEKQDEIPTQLSEEVPQRSEARQSQAMTGEDEGMLATVLNRFPWIKHLSETQITRRLYRSGESEFFLNQVSCRLRDVKEFLRVVGMSPRSHTIVAQGEVAKIIHAKPDDRRLILEEAAGVLGFRDKINAATRRLRETGENLERVEDIIREVSRQVGSLRRQAQRAESRAGLKAELFSADAAVLRLRVRSTQEQLEQCEAELKSGEAKLLELSAELDARGVTERDLRGRLLASDIEGDSLRSQIDALRFEINERAEKVLQRKARLGEVQAFLKAGDTERRRIDERMSLLEERRAEVESVLHGLREQREHLAEQIPESGRVDETTLRAIEAELKEARASLQITEADVRTTRETLAGMRGAVVAHERQIKALSPTSALDSKAVREKLDAFLGSDDVRVTSLAECFDVPTEFASALQAALRERSDYFVSADWSKVVAWFAELSEEEREGIHSLGVLNASGNRARPTNSNSLSSALLEQYGVRRLRDCFSVEDTSVAALADHLVEGFLLVDSVKRGMELLEAAAFPEGTQFVTPAGEVLSDEVYALLSHSGGLLELQAMHKELVSKVSGTEEELARHEQLRATQEAIVDEIQQRHGAELKRVQVLQTKLRDLLSEKAVIEGRLGSEVRSREQLEQDRARAEQSLTNLVQRQEELQQEAQVLGEELGSLDSEADRLAHEKLRNLNEQYRVLEERRLPDRQRLEEVSSSLNELRTSIDEVRRAVEHQRLEMSRVRMEQEHVRERFSELYSTQIAEEVLGQGIDDQAPLAELESKAKQLRERIQREGEVDPTSIEEYQRESERLESLRTQQADLKEASKTLSETIDRLRAMSEELFLANFNTVRQHFSALIPRLFGGGKGELVLIDETRPLESGIEIIARPPGKKLKSIDLMSGGEKALCATALIVAMFTVRPAPLCILDEVDAPLDEANLGRFLGLVKEMSEQTQFLMITHNKASMSASDQLVGVTMEQPGASKVLQVSLQEAYQHVA